MNTHGAIRSPPAQAVRRIQEVEPPDSTRNPKPYQTLNPKPHTTIRSCLGTLKGIYFSDPPNVGVWVKLYERVRVWSLGHRGPCSELPEGSKVVPFWVS